MALTLQLDHVVIRVHDLDAACADYAALGFSVVPGGEHPALGSRNALIPFEDGSYLELIAFPGATTSAPTNVPAAVLRRVRGWETSGEGLVDFAVVPSDVAAALGTARERGLEIEGPFPGSRRRTDGQEVAWQFGIPPTGEVPFLCADVTPRELRVPTGAARHHANGVSGLYRVVVGVTDRAESLARYRALLGTEPQPAADLLGLSDAVEFALGSSGIVLVDIGGTQRHAALTPRKVGPAYLYFQMKGERTYRALDAALTHHVTMICL